MLLNEAYTPLKGLAPLRPIVCPVCGEQLGAWWKYGKTWTPEYRKCTDRCESVKEYAKHNVDHNKPLNVPKGWRDAGEWSSPLLLTGYADWIAREIK